MSTSRLEAFADGIFAIAATLLILNVGTDATGRDLGPALLHAWPSYVAYAVSFVTMGIIWANHHTFMHQIEHTDRTFLLLSVVFLMAIAFIPFPTRLVAENIQDPDAARAAALAYGITLTFTAVMFNVVWLYASVGRRLLNADADPKTVSGITRSYLPGPWIYLAATLVVLVNVAVGVVLFLAISAFYVLESSVFGRREPPSSR
jgi:TMEM175 potassium channel family protein